MKLYVCASTFSALQRFIRRGLPPGGFAMALLMQDEARARACVHPHIRGGVVVDMLRLTSDYLPAGFFDTAEKIADWEAHDGLMGASEPQKAQLYLITPRWWDWYRPANK